MSSKNGQMKCGIQIFLGTFVTKGCRQSRSPDHLQNLDYILHATGVASHGVSILVIVAD